MHFIAAHVRTDSEKYHIFPEVFSASIILYYIQKLFCLILHNLDRPYIRARNEFEKNMVSTLLKNKM